MRSRRLAWAGLCIGFVVVAGCARVGVPESRPAPEVSESPPTTTDGDRSAADAAARDREARQRQAREREARRRADAARRDSLAAAERELADEAAAGGGVVEEAGPATPSSAREAWLAGPDEILESAYARHEDIAERVEFWKDFWQGRGRGYFQRYLNRMALYMPLVERELIERGLPPSLRYLPVIESGYNPIAVSRVGATGLWQFMSPTARWLGMRVDGFVDERRDPARSTEEALGYLTSLRGEFDSWFLALAAYNSGPGRVSGVLRRNAPDAPRGDSLFWAMSERFPTETSLFVPKLLAAVELASNPEQYGFTRPSRADSLTYELVEVPNATSLDVVAEAANAELEAVVALNPHLVQRVTPVGTSWSVRIPPGGALQFAERLAEIPEDDRVTFLQHRVASGETLGHIAEDYGIRVSQLRAANPGVSPRRLQIGQNLIIPKGPATGDQRVASRAPERRATSDQETAPEAAPAPTRVESQSASTSSASADATHVVQSGENPWTISRRYGVPLNDLMAWNGLNGRSVLRPGDRLTVRGAGERMAARVSEYRVQSGDTLSEIAERHGVSTRALMDHNRLTSRSVIRPGDRIRIPG